MRAALALVCAGMYLLAQPGPAIAETAAASAASPVQSPILTLDDERLFSGSAFGKAVLALQKAETDRLVDENRRIEAGLEVEEKDLTDRRSQMSRTDFTPLSDAFNLKVEGIRKAQDAKTRELARRFDDERQRFIKAVQPILIEVLAARGAVAIIDNRAVFVGFDNIDVTDEAISRLDAAYSEGRLTPAAP